MSMDLVQRLGIEDRLDALERTQRRICFELDVLARGVAKLLEANQCKKEAERLLQDFEDLRSERDLEASERPTMPPPENK